MQGARILVTGGGGMIGANLVRRLLADGAQVQVLSRSRDVPVRLAGLDVTCHRVDYADTTSVAAAVQLSAPDVVFHLTSSPFNPPTTPAAVHLAGNALATLNLLEAVNNRPATRFIATASAAEYGAGAGLTEDARRAPATVYGATKLCGSILVDAYARSAGVKATNVLLFTPFGPWERPGRLIPHAILSALRGETIRIGHGGQKRDYLFIDDTTDALVRAAETDLAPGTPINISSGVSRTIRDVVQRLIDLMGIPVALETNPAATRPDEIWDLSGSPARAESLLGWRPTTSFDDGLLRTIDWYRRNQNLAHTLP